MGLQTVNLKDSKGLEGLIVGICLGGLATTAVVLRLLSRRMMKVQLGADDYMIIVALIFAYACIVSNVFGVVYGAIGIHIEHVKPSQLTVFYKNLIPVVLLWASACTSVKISLLLLYIRVFALRAFRKLAYVVMAVVMGWWLSVFLEEFLLCRPFSFTWDRHVEGGVCGDEAAAYLAAGIVNLCTDIMVLCLPIPMVLKLQLPLRNRVVLLIVFGVGFLVCIVSCLRITAVVAWRVTDPTYTMWPTIIWSQVEFMLGITCSCVPLMRPVFGRYFALHLTKNSRDSYNPIDGKFHVPEGARELHGGTFQLEIPFSSSVVYGGKSQKPVVAESIQSDAQREEGRAIQVETGWDVQYTPHRISAAGANLPV